MDVCRFDCGHFLKVKDNMCSTCREIVRGMLRAERKQCANVVLRHLGEDNVVFSKILADIEDREKAVLPE